MKFTDQKNMKSPERNTPRRKGDQQVTVTQSSRIRWVTGSPSASELNTPGKTLTLLQAQTIPLTQWWHQLPWADPLDLHGALDDPQQGSLHLTATPGQWQ